MGVGEGERMEVAEDGVWTSCSSDCSPDADETSWVWSTSLSKPSRGKTPDRDLLGRRGELGVDEAARRRRVPGPALPPPPPAPECDEGEEDSVSDWLGEEAVDV